MLRLHDSRRTSLSAPQQHRNPQPESIARNRYHKAQGATVNRTLVYGSALMDRHLAYVALTRHRDDAVLYASREVFGTVADLARRFSRDGSASTTLDHDFMRQRVTVADAAAPATTVVEIIDPAVRGVPAEAQRSVREPMETASVADDVGPRSAQVAAATPGTRPARTSDDTVRAKPAVEQSTAQERRAGAPARRRPPPRPFFPPPPAARGPKSR